MASYKKNHEVPRTLIARWAEKPSRYVWVFDIAEERIYRSTGTGSSPYKFTIVPNRYVHRRGENRNEIVELWLSRGES